MILDRKKDFTQQYSFSGCIEKTEDEKNIVILTLLRKNEKNISDEISEKLSAIIPEFSIIISLGFYSNPTQWIGMLTIRPKTPGALNNDLIADQSAIIELIKTTITTTISRHLPIDAPLLTTQCDLSFPKHKKSELKEEITSIRESVGELFIAVVSFLLMNIKFALRKTSHLPYIITGANPYAFSSQCSIHQTIYSKITFRLFGWASLCVVGYVALASSKIANLLLSTHSKTLSFAVSIIAAIIVFYCDRFILSFPKIRVSVPKTIRKIEINLAQNNKEKLILIAYDLFIEIISLRWMATSLLSIFRIALAIIISSLLISSTFIEANGSKIPQEIARLQHESGINSLKNTIKYADYESSIEKERQSYFKKEANKICAQIAVRGKESNDTGKIEANDKIMSGALKNPYVEKQSTPPDFDCGIKRTKPCSQASLSCPEYGRIIKEQDQFNTNHVSDYNDATNLKNQIESQILAHDQLSHPEDLSIRIEALASIYTQKKTQGTLWYELAIAFPFILILLVFELIPAIAKMFFPPSAYDHLVAKEELFQQLNCSIPQTNEIKHLIENHFNPSSFSPTLENLKQLDSLEKEKNEELKKSMELMFEKIRLTAHALNNTIGSSITLILITSLILAIFSISSTSASMLGDFISSLYDWESFWKNIFKLDRI